VTSETKMEQLPPPSSNSNNLPCIMPELVLPTSYRRIPFNIHCPAQQLYLLIAAEDGSSTVLHQMETDDGDRWYVTVRLLTSSYRYRYCAEYVVVMPHTCPDVEDNTPIRLDGGDLVLNVPSSMLYGIVSSGHKRINSIKRSSTG
jgi:hypothetical protein